jgi:thiaminase/transcriptional activator TenA
MRFTDELWQHISPTYEAILAHPFLTELENGSLSRDRFAFYMKQDSLYLQDFSRALAITGARSTDLQAMQSYYGFAHEAAVVESALHEGYFKEFGVTLDVERAPACFAYGSYLLATAATGSYAEAVASLLPCFWIYRDVGNEIWRRAEGSLGTNPYARWIETYAGDEFNAVVERAIAITDDVAQAGTPADRTRMRAAFEKSSRLEWMFWDSAYRLESWPPNSA